MIHLTRPDGQAAAFNPDLIERIETTSNTILVMATGSRCAVLEDPETIAARIREWRASVMSLVDYLEIRSHPGYGHSVHSQAEPSLRVVSDPSDHTAHDRS